MKYSDMQMTVLRAFVLPLAAIAPIGLVACGTDNAPDVAASQSEPPADEHEGEDEHEEEVVLTAAQLESAGVETAPLGGGVITTHLSLPAEVGLNEDTLVHVAPRVPGVAIDVRAFLGDDVAPEQTLAVLESSELGEAKIALLQAIQRRTVAEADLERQRTISNNTERLLALMNEEPSLDRLRSEASGLRIGEDKGRLVSAYARLHAAEANYERERTLQDQGLSTQADLLAAQEAYNSSLAEYMSVFEDVDFMYRVRLDEAERAASVAKSAVENAERRLLLLGLTADEVDRVAQEPRGRIARYEIKAPIAGRVIEKHITPGERLANEDAVYTIADLSTVWMNIAVYEKYLGRIREGQRVIVHAGDREAGGEVIYIASTLSEGTRTTTARVVLENNERRWKPGEFLTVRIETGKERVARRVPVEAIQQWEGSEVVFVRHEDGGFAPQPVEIGRRNDDFVEIAGDGIPIGTPVVVKNSFLFKAELGKSTAGHGH